MIILAFLGNPGKKYSHTRHNIGFIAGQFFARETGISINKKNFLSECGTGSVAGHDALLLFPQTFMNLSGQAVKKAMDFYRTEHSGLITVHDEIELPFGEIRTKTGGGHKGHNGLRSIIAETGSADFHRIRFGVGRPENPQMEVADHVLSNFTSEESEKINQVLPEVSKLIISIISKQ
ncbi:MAG TPA: aminoacyl-tRNA hydrolase [Spirochaetota bacterium]|nr:aminoacyl-tRNA hydrolase [Spirochaetota bacterium]